MGDLNRGATSTFAAGDTITAAKLHKLIDDAEVKAGSIGTTKLADGAVTDAKLAAGITITAAKVTLPEGSMMIGSPLNVGVHIPVGSTLTKSAILDVADSSLGEAKFSDGSVATAKLKTLDPSPAGTYGSATSVPVVVVNNKGQVTGVSTVAVNPPGMLTKTIVGGVSMPSASGDSVTIAHSGGADAMAEVFAECVDPNQGYLVGDRVPLWCFFADEGSNDFPSFGVGVSSTSIKIVRNDDLGGVFTLHAEDGKNLQIDESKWVLKAYVIS